MRRDLEEAVDAAAYHLGRRLEALVDSLPDRGMTAPNLGSGGQRDPAGRRKCEHCGTALMEHTLETCAPLDSTSHPTVQ